jgi:transposase
MSSRKRYSAEYKQEAVQMVRSAKVPVSQVARELGLNANMPGRWCRESRGTPAKPFPGPGKPRDEELAALKRDLARVTKERDFLREAAAFFAKGSK